MKLNLKTITECQKDEFVNGWENAGGYMDDLNSDNPNPWCCPWYWRDTIDVEGKTFEEMGADWWRQCKDEVEELRAEEEELRAEEEE